jgi:hypothetical protein
MSVQIVRCCEKAVPTFNPATNPAPQAIVLVAGMCTKDYMILNGTGTDIGVYISLVVPDGVGGFTQHFIDYSTPCPPGTTILTRLLPFRVTGEYIGIGATITGLTIVVNGFIQT